MIETTAERRDMDALLDQLLAFARDMLRKQGTVAPFAAVTKADGRMALVAGSGAAQASPDEVMGMVVQGLRDQARTGDIRACGVCYAVQMPTDLGQFTEAIAVSLEDVLGGSAMVYMPFTRGGRFGGWKFDEITVSSGEPRVFVAA